MPPAVPPCPNIYLSYPHSVWIRNPTEDYCLDTYVDHSCELKLCARPREYMCMNGVL